jgi:hypothetical protein
MTEKFISRYRGAKIKEVLEIRIVEGEGTNESPIREVIYLCEKDGKVIVRIDKHLEEKE